LIREYDHVWIGASIARLRLDRNECDVVHDNLKSSFEKGIGRRRTGKCERVCDESNRFRQFESPAAWIVYEDI
jgi:hypothetical protein